MITPLPEILKAMDEEQKNAMSNTHWNVCYLCGLSEKSTEDLTRTLKEIPLCGECKIIKAENPLIFNKMLVIHAYAWEKGLQAAAD